MLPVVYKGFYTDVIIRKTKLFQEPEPAIDEAKAFFLCFKIMEIIREILLTLFICFIDPPKSRK